MHTSIASLESVLLTKSSVMKESNDTSPTFIARWWSSSMVQQPKNLFSQSLSFPASYMFNEHTDGSSAYEQIDVQEH